jgi:SpoIIAA-like
MVMPDFHDWDARALWEDIKWAAKYFNHIERVTMIGDKKWQEWMAAFCKLFTRAKVRYFDHENLDEARTWATSPA